MNPQNVELLIRLCDAGVEMVVVGGIAAVLHGSSLPTEDLDVCSPITTANMARLITAIGPLHPRFRFHPKRPALTTDADHLATFRNLNLITDLGILDVLGEITGLGGYPEVAKHAVRIEIQGRLIQVLDLDSLIRAKEAAGRNKDKLGVMHLDSLKRRKELGESE